MHILSPETDNCPSWISGRERMTVENISWSISTKECCTPRWGLNPRPPGLQSDGASNWAIEASVLRSYGPVNPMGSCRVQSVYLTTRLLGRLSPLSGWPVFCTFFRQKLLFLNQWKGKNDCRKYFMINLHERMLPTWRGLNPWPPGLQSDAENTLSSISVFRDHLP